MTDEFEMRDTARALVGLYRELNEAKYTQQAPRGERVMKPSPGPRDPAPTWAVSLDHELTARLFEMVRDACNHIQPTKILHHDGGRLAAWIAWHAQAVSELDFADDLLDEMRDQVRVLSRKLRPAGLQEVARRAEPYQPAAAIVQILSRLGFRVTRAQLRQWSSRGHISTKKRAKQGVTYRLSEVHQYLTGDEDESLVGGG